MSKPLLLTGRQQEQTAGASSLQQDRNEHEDDEGLHVHAFLRPGPAPRFANYVRRDVEKQCVEMGLIECSGLGPLRRTEEPTHQARRQHLTPLAYGSLREKPPDQHPSGVLPTPAGVSS